MGCTRSATIALLFLLASCGDVVPDADSGTAIDSAPGLIDATPIDSAVVINDAGLPDAAPCNSFAGTWYGNEMTFTSAVGTTQFVDFETMGDMNTTPTSGVVVPKDEYLSCCGIQVEYDGTDPTGELIWAGNLVGGFALRTNCQDAIFCSGAGPHTIRVTFVNGAAAAGGMQPSPNYFAWVYDQAGNEIGPNTNTVWMGYASATPLSAAKFGRSSSGNLESVRYQLCQ